MKESERNDQSASVKMAIGIIFAAVILKVAVLKIAEDIVNSQSRDPETKGQTAREFSSFAPSTRMENVSIEPANTHNRCLFSSSIPSRSAAPSTRIENFSVEPAITRNQNHYM